MQTIERHHWDESGWERASHQIDLFRDGVKQGVQPFNFDDFSLPAVTGPRNKKSGLADPRFKRVVTPGQADEIAAEARKVSESFTRAAASSDDRSVRNEPVSITKSSKIPTFHVKKNPSKSENISSRFFLADDTSGKSSSRPVRLRNHEYKSHLRDENPEMLENAIKSKSKSAESQAIRVTQPAKKSISDCTLQTKNTSLDDDGVEEYNRLQSFTSTSRLAKVNNWMREFKPSAEKRRSVITVIGQTQGKSFSAILNEINQRRKLAKELDKHALCENIVQSKGKEIEQEPNGLIAKVDFVSPNGKVMYSTRKIYGFRDSPTLSSIKNNRAEDLTCAVVEPLKSGGKSYKLNDQIPERDVPLNQTRKRKSKRSSKKPECRKFHLRGARDVVQEIMRNYTVIKAVAVICMAIFCMGLLMVKEHVILNYLNIGKPKVKSWYDDFF